MTSKHQLNYQSQRPKLAFPIIIHQHQQSLDTLCELIIKLIFADSCGDASPCVGEFPPLVAGTVVLIAKNSYFRYQTWKMTLLRILLSQVFHFY